MPIAYILQELWRWFATTGINLLLLLLLALLVPRAGRFAKRFVANRVRETMDADEGKSRLAVAGVGVYVVQVIAFFVIFVFILQQIGFSLAGAAIPATVVSAAIGFGAQNIIADFLAGFFILTERQYGVGDNVTFQGNGLDISGDVIQITMRATQIRTLNQATVTIPNSAARIYINQSNYWVNAMVVIPVPLEGSESAEQVVDRSERAARRALERDDIRPKVIGELQSHPAVALNPPNTAGMPWTVDMRFMVRVQPLSQWMVERAIRVAILDEFWSEYGSPTELFPRIDASAHPTFAASARSTATTDFIPQVAASDPAAASTTDTETFGSTRVVEAKLDPAALDGAADSAASGAENGAEHETSEAPKTVFDGFMRASTLWLIVAFIIALLVRGMTLTPGEESASGPGVLAPPPPAATREGRDGTQPSEHSDNSNTPESEMTSPTAGATETRGPSASPKPPSEVSSPAHQPAPENRQPNDAPHPTETAETGAPTPTADNSATATPTGAPSSGSEPTQRQPQPPGRNPSGGDEGGSGADISAVD